MKKVIAIFAVLALTASVSFAQQNIGNATQSGSNQEAEIEQTGGYAEAYIWQSNMRNSAYVEQINKLEPNEEDGILANIYQSGRRNTATAFQTLLNSTLNKDGGLEVYVNQTGDRNTAKQIQGAHSQMDNSYAEILQSGDKNYAFQEQVRYGNRAYINQTGNKNTARQAQDTELPDEVVGSNNYANILQTGDNNDADQEQHGWANNVQANQSGNHNESLQLQRNNSWVTEGYVYQSGDRNVAEQDQVGNENRASIWQYTDRNEARQFQSQSGDSGGNSTGYAGTNIGEIRQLGGDNNKAIQTQDWYGPSEDFQNLGYIYQNGAHLKADQTQKGQANLSHINQSGSNNTATVNQLNGVTLP